jgi:hypothetical protein
MNSAVRLGSVSSLLPGGPVMHIVYGHTLVGMLNTDAVARFPVLSANPTIQESEGDKKAGIRQLDCEGDRGTGGTFVVRTA